jgi:coenzyme F420 hydrogenase subunit beta
MVMAPIGSLRPERTDDFSAEEEATLLAACPGVIARPRQLLDVEPDPVWGAHGTMRLGWAADPTVRFEAATGGALTALGMHLVASGQVAFVLHVGQEDGDGFDNQWVISETPEDVFANKGSRYGPVAALAGVEHALSRNEPFALIAKPCDAAAVHALAQVDERVDRLCTHRMVMVCGGQSRLSKSIGAAADFGLGLDEVDSIRYRGHGNPGPTVIFDRDGNEHSLSYLEMWADEGTWDLDSRCTVCPDALGEAADIAASDAWPGGAPIGEDEGFNGLIAYSEAGEQLLRDAVAAGALVLGDPITPREFDELQPHQVRKKVALSARFEALAAAGKPVIDATGLRVDRLGERLTAAERARETEGTAVRIGRGRYSG